MADAMYSTDGEGYWIRREWAPQCEEKVFLTGRCQGVKGHEGVHWHYKPNGSFAWSDNEDDPQHEGCSGTVPPGHADYSSPVEMQHEYWLSHFTDQQVVDPDEIARLERGDLRDHESI